MSQPVAGLIDVAGQRAFDPHFTGTSRAFVRDLFSRCQQFVNAAFDSTIVVQPMATGPQLQVYNFERVTPANDVLRIKSVRDGSRDLSRIEFDRLKHIDNHWFGRSGPRFRSFAILGRRILVIHPQRTVASEVNVVYTQQLPVLDQESATVNLPDDQLPLLVKMVEAMILLKQRDLDKLKPLLDGLTAEVQAIKQAQGMAA
jgi:hypothetical protein